MENPQGLKFEFELDLERIILLESYLNFESKSQQIRDEIFEDNPHERFQILWIRFKGKIQVSIPVEFGFSPP